MKPRCVLLIVGCLFLPSFAATPECRGLSPEDRKAIQELVDFRYPQPDWPIPYEGNDERPIVAQLKKNSGKIIHCLLEIYRTNPDQAGYWPYKSPPPKDGRKMLTAIEKIDPKTGIKLYREIRTATLPDSEERLESSLSMAMLGDDEVLGEICSFLADPSALRSGSGDATANLIHLSVRIMAKRNYHPALGALQKLSKENPADSFLELATAQLANEVELVRLYAFDPVMYGESLKALLRMGRRDIVEKLAKDPYFPFRDAARYVLTNPDE